MSDGQVALITGAGSGIAEATARLFAARGASVVLGDISGDRVEAVAASIRDAGGDASAHVLDVRSDSSVRSFVAAAAVAPVRARAQEHVPDRV